MDVLIAELNSPDQWQRPVGFLCLFACLRAQIVSGCGPKPNIHRNYVTFDLVPSGFFMVGIQQRGLERSWSAGVWGMYVGSWCPVCTEMLKVFISARFHVADVISSSELVGLADTTAC